jgi:gas vesicle protein
MKKVAYFFYGGLTGAIIGGILGLLLAPAKGQETCSILKQRIDAASSQFNQAVDERRMELEKEIQDYPKK